MSKPKITISFECKKEIHTDQLIEIHRFIANQNIYESNTHLTLECVELDGDLIKLFINLDPEYGKEESPTIIFEGDHDV